MPSDQASPTPAVTPAIKAVEAPLLEVLDRLTVTYELHRHAPVYTVSESADLKATIPGGHSKNLFVKDKKGQRALLVAESTEQVDLKGVAKRLGMGRVSFVSGDQMQETLGVIPGSVTPFALLNVRIDPKSPPPFHLVFDSRLMCHSPVSFHPLHNEATLSLSPNDLILFARTMGYEPHMFDLGLPDA